MSFLRQLQEACLNSVESKYLTIKEELLEMVIALPLQRQYTIRTDSSLNLQCVQWIADKLREEGLEVRIGVGVLSDLSLVITGLDKIQHEQIDECESS